MKVIDLLNKIANGEEVPKYIKYYNRLHQKEDTMMCCYNNIIYKLDNNIIDLLDEVEIIEDEPRDIEVCGSFFTRSEYNRLAGIEEDKKIEKLNLDTDELRGKEIPRAIDYLLESKINEIIDYINKEDK